MSDASMTSFTTDKWTQIGQAPPAFWIAVGGIILALTIFAVWTYFSGRVPKSINPATLGSVVGFLIIWTFVLYLVPALTAMQVQPTERTWNWAPGEVLQDPGGSGLTGEPYRGYEVYVANSCAACHTLYVRAQDLGTGWSEGNRDDDVARVEDYVRMTEPPLGTQRNGPDLSFIGRRIADMTYQIDHLVDPRKYKAFSVMPSYRHLSERDLQDLAAFLVTLGNPKDALLSGEGLAMVPVELSPQMQLASDLYRSQGCVGCHSVDGRPNVGPTWLGLWESERELESGETVIADAAYLHESIVDPNAQIVRGYPAAMPPYGHLTDEEIDALIAFIESLSGEEEDE